MTKALLFSIFASLTVVACGAAAGDPSGESAYDALTSASTGPAYYVLVRPNTTKNKGDAFVAPANGGTMKCAGGNIAASCLATVDATNLTGPDGIALSAAEASAARASFLAGNAIVQGTFGKTGNVLAAAKAWSSVAAPPASTSAKLWLVAPTATTFKDLDLGVGAVRYAATLDLSRLHLAADVETSVRAGVSTNGGIVRGTHHGSGASVTLGADAVFAPVAHVSAPATGLTAAQEATALHDIDSTCGDTWCDGDYNFRFDTLTCNFATGTCTLGLEVTYPNDGSPDAKWLPGTCALTGYHAFSDLVTVQTPVASAITATLSNDMFNCTQAVEATVPK